MVEEEKTPEVAPQARVPTRWAIIMVVIAVGAGMAAGTVSSRIFVSQETKDRTAAIEELAHKSNAKDCKSYNDLRAAFIGSVRQGPGTGGGGSRQIPPDIGDGSASTEELRDYINTVLLAGQGGGGSSYADFLEKSVPTRDCKKEARARD